MRVLGGCANSSGMGGAQWATRPEATTHERSVAADRSEDYLGAVGILNAALTELPVEQRGSRLVDVTPAPIAIESRARDCRRLLQFPRDGVHVSCRSEQTQDNRVTGPIVSLGSRALDPG